MKRILTGTALAVALGFGLAAPAQAATTSTPVCKSYPMVGAPNLCPRTSPAPGRKPICKSYPVVGVPNLCPTVARDLRHVARVKGLFPAPPRPPKH